MCSYLTQESETKQITRRLQSYAHQRSKTYINACTLAGECDCAGAPQHNYERHKQSADQAQVDTTRNTKSITETSRAANTPRQHSAIHHKK